MHHLRSIGAFHAPYENLPVSRVCQKTEPFRRQAIADLLGRDKIMKGRAQSSLRVPAPGTAVWQVGRRG